MELAVNDINLAVVEIGGEEEVVGADLTESEGLVDGAVGGLKADLRREGRRIGARDDADAGIPTGDEAGLRSKDKCSRRGFSSIGDLEVGSRVEHLAGRDAAGDGDLEWLRDFCTADVARV